MNNLILRILKFFVLCIKDDTGSFNLGIGPNGGIAARFALHAYLYDSIVYRRWIAQIALMFYTGR